MELQRKVPYWILILYQNKKLNLFHFWFAQYDSLISETINPINKLKIIMKELVVSGPVSRFWISNIALASSIFRFGSFFSIVCFWKSSVFQWNPGLYSKLELQNIRHLLSLILKKYPSPSLGLDNFKYPLQDFFNW